MSTSSAPREDSANSGSPSAWHAPPDHIARTKAVAQTKTVPTGKENCIFAPLESLALQVAANAPNAPPEDMSQAKEWETAAPSHAIRATIVKQDNQSRLRAKLENTEWAIIQTKYAPGRARLENTATPANTSAICVLGDTTALRLRKEWHGMAIQINGAATLDARRGSTVLRERHGRKMHIRAVEVRKKNSVMWRQTHVIVQKAPRRQ
jgi:hypothetical protein